MKLYICGPMSGIARFNYPAFEEAATNLRGRGYEVVSPVELDTPLERGIALASKDGKADPKDWERFLERDLKAIDDVDAVVLLQGWTESKGALKEYSHALAKGLPGYHYEDIIASQKGPTALMRTRCEWEDMHGRKNDKRPLEEALDVVHTCRHGEYGHPTEDFARTAGMWKALFGWDVKPQDVPLAMVCLKASRLQQSPSHRDSVVDMGGYAECYWMVME